MDHAEAIRTGAAEKYLLDELDDDERARYEEHFFDCADCAADVKCGAAFVDNARAVFAETASERRKAQADEKPHAPWWALFWPVPAGALAALVLMLGLPGAYLAVVEVPRLRNALAEAESPQAATWQFLSVTRSEPPVVKVSKATRMVGLTLSRSSESRFAYYRCEVREPGGPALSSAVLPAPPPGGELNVVIPVSHLRPGAHELALHGLGSASGPVVAPDLARYGFVLERE
jgi:hypothetical protein